MATSNDHPDLPFVQAQGYTRGRSDGPPLWIVWHTMEAGENSQRAESTAAYFADPSDGRQVSSHYCADNDSVVQCVDLDDIAWTVGNRPGNYRGINWELSGFANQTRQQWLDAFGQGMFHQVIPLVVADAIRFGIPHRRCSINDLVAKKPGHTTHNDLRIAFGVTTHTDPGPNFPFDYLLALLNGAVDMFLAQVTGNNAIYLSDGQTHRHLTNIDNLTRLRAIGIQTIVVANQNELLDLCGVAWTAPGISGGVSLADVDARISATTLQPPNTKP